MEKKSCSIKNLYVISKFQVPLHLAHITLPGIIKWINFCTELFENYLSFTFIFESNDSHSRNFII